MVKRYSHNFRVAAPLESVAEFHRDSQALKLLTPFPLSVQVHRQEPMGEESIVDFTLWLGPFPVRWVAQHKDIDPVHGFTDVQVRGPFAYWEHKHTFNSVDERTSTVEDDIQALMGKTPIKWIVCLLMWVGLPLLFAYRSWATRNLVEKRWRENEN